MIDDEDGIVCSRSTESFQVPNNFDLKVQRILDNRTYACFMMFSKESRLDRQKLFVPDQIERSQCWDVNRLITQNSNRCVFDEMLTKLAYVERQLLKLFYECPKRVQRSLRQKLGDRILRLRQRGFHDKPNFG